MTITMSKKLLSALFLTALAFGFGSGVRADDFKTVNVFDKVVFYDGYQGVVVDSELNDGILRFKNSLYAVKLDPETIKDMGDNLRMEVVIGALCDNYDRIGNVDIAFVPKGLENYEYDAVERIEVTRFITPFMDKNKNPKEVPYEYEIANVGRILRDATLSSQYDFWLEFELFGIPYAANQQIRGCANRNDVFEGTIDLVYSPREEAEEDGNIIVPIYVKKPEDHGNINFNNYNEVATDTLGVTTRTFEFEVPEDVADSRIYLILTNHGAGTNGEEYVRRLHIVYFDDEVILSYKPGGVSCEPYREYNTQANGIYSTSRSSLFWLMYSNWCPGQAVPIRELPTGALKAGKHKVMIRVPDAEFYGKDGDFRPSLYFHGVREGSIGAGVNEVWMEGPEIKLSRSGNELRFTADETLAEVYVHSYDGLLLDIIAGNQNRIDLRNYGNDVLILTFVTPEGRTSVKQIRL